MTTLPHTDLKFFTNEPGETLYDRFVKTLGYAQYFDVLVGYFRTSGFKKLHEALEHVDKVRILVGLSVDRRAFELIETSRQGLDFDSHRRTRASFESALSAEMEGSEDTLEVELSARKFVEFLRAGRLELRAHPSKDIHAKVYISRFPQDFINYGSVITGSSNFSLNGLEAQREFNVELKDVSDVRFALQKFEALWAEGVDISEAYIDTLTTKTWLNDRVTPYELFLKFLYEYFKEDLSVADEVDYDLPDGLMDLAYQRQAVVSARKVLDTYGGVFLADVVGLGKTFVSARLLRGLPGRKLILCPPVLADYWRETLREFYVPGFEVESLGKLEPLLAKGVDKYSVVLVDEAHRFRNELTQSYEALHAICRNKKVILVSATPLNNRLGDILAQLKLFQPGKKSDVPGVRNLEAFFREQQRQLDGLDKADPSYREMVQRTSEVVRDKVLKHVMVRRTRSEIRNYFSEDLSQQGLFFPELGDPKRIIYTFDEATNEAFTNTVSLLQSFAYARYVPAKYLKRTERKLEQAQNNVGGFMKTLLVKRLESSFHAFERTVERFITSYEKYLAMLEGGVVYISNKVDVYDLLDGDDEARLLDLVEQDEAQRFEASVFEAGYRDALVKDLAILKSILFLWRKVERDPKLEEFIARLHSDPLLKDQKVLIFTESKETGDYLHEHLNKAFPREVMFYSSAGGVQGEQSYSVAAAREAVKANFDPKHPQPQNNVRLLVTTDVLAEGINLHRSNVVINYDLPWNPTRVMQRVGRVNRVGTAFERVYVYNFFPTDQSDEHLGLEGNIKAKIQAFHYMLGEDAKYLSSDEEVGTHELFGERLYKKLTNKESLEGEDAEEASELKYLQAIRRVRDEDAKLFERVKKLPKKARSGRKAGGDDSDARNHLITFFRRGRLKKFMLACSDDSASPLELTFLEAATRLECPPDAPRRAVGAGYYELLSANKEAFARLTSDIAQEEQDAQGGTTNERTVLKILRAIKGNPRFSEGDDLVERSLHAFDEGRVSKNHSKRLKAAFDKAGANPGKLVAALRSEMTEDVLYPSPTREDDAEPREVILSQYFEVEDA